MSKVLVTEDYLEDIADAIRGKLSSSDTYTPGQMAGAIKSIPSGGITPTGTISITENGDHDVTNYATASVDVSGGGGSNSVYIKSSDGTIGVYVSDSEFKVYFNGFTKTASDVSIASIVSAAASLIPLLYSSNRYSQGLVYTRAYASDKTTNFGFIGFYNGFIRSWEDNLVTQKAGSFWAVIDFLNTTVQQNNPYTDPPQ